MCTCPFHFAGSRRRDSQERARSRLEGGTAGNLNRRSDGSSALTNFGPFVRCGVQADNKQRAYVQTLVGLRHCPVRASHSTRIVPLRPARWHATLLLIPHRWWHVMCRVTRHCTDLSVPVEHDRRGPSKFVKAPSPRNSLVRHPPARRPNSQQSGRARQMGLTCWALGASAVARTHAPPTHPPPHRAHVRVYSSSQSQSNQIGLQRGLGKVSIVTSWFSRMASSS